MDNENLDTLLENAFSSDDTTDAPSGEESQQEGSNTAEENKAPVPSEDAEKRRRNAEKRIRREQRIADEARNAERTRTNELLKRHSIERPDGGVIDSVDALEAFDRSQSDERIASGRANADDMRRIVREVMTENKPNGEDEVERQLEALRDMEPEWADKTTKEVLGAIIESDIGADFRAEVEKGATFLQAYGKATKAASARAKGSAASAAAKAASKGHLSSTSTRGEGSLEVPSDEMAMFRELIPGATDAEIRDFYNRDRKRMK